MKTSSFKNLEREPRGLSTMEYSVLFVIIVVGALTLWSKLGGPFSADLDESVELSEH